MSVSILSPNYVGAKPTMLIPKETYTYDYPRAIEFAKEQVKILWPPDEIDVTKDIHDIKTRLTEAEYHGMVTVLKLFTLYEQKVGQDYWAGYFCKVFKRPDLRRMANCFSFFEDNIHAVFYNRINELLGLNTDEFYSSYKDIEVLAGRMKFIEELVGKKHDINDILVSVGTMSMIEGAILFEGFSYIKHFNSTGKSKLLTLNSGIDFSIDDESIHALAGAWSFNQLLHEAVTVEVAELDLDYVHDTLIKNAEWLYEHECLINDKIYEKGEPDNISKKASNIFIGHRLNRCLENMNLPTIFSEEGNSIAKWFYRDLKSSVLHDTFITQGSDYSRAWNRDKFGWKK
jgi:ribonucleotide reductase beta subunit family protein with ferritin-like domain